jgi:elongation of very long chain fatty acids protein 7
MLAAMGPHMQKYLWWKKYLTIFQMAQFIAIFIHAMQLNFYNPCNFPKIFVYWIAANAVLYLILFMGFYRRAYTSKKNFIKHEKQNTDQQNGFFVAKKMTIQEKSFFDSSFLQAKKVE